MEKENKLVVWWPLGEDGLRAKVVEAVPGLPDPRVDVVEAARRAKERREYLMDVPRLAKRARLDYRRLIYKGEPWQPNRWISVDFMEWLEDNVQTALYDAWRHGIVTKEEYEFLWGLAIDQWTELVLEIRAHERGTWCWAYYGAP